MKPIRSRVTLARARAAIAAAAALAVVAAGGTAIAQRTPAKTATTSGVYTGVLNARSKVFKWNIFGSRSQRRVTLGFAREGDKLQVHETSHDALAPGKAYTTSTTGHVVVERVNGRGETELTVRFGGQAFVDQVTKAARVLEREKGLAPTFSIVDAVGETTYTFRKDGAVHVEGRGGTRVNVELPGLAGSVMRAIMRSDLRATSRGDLLKTGQR